MAWVVGKISLNSPLFGAAIWGHIVVLFKIKEPSTTSCLQSHGMQFVL
jgi:hypothetical protein